MRYGYAQLNNNFSALAMRGAIGGMNLGVNLAGILTYEGAVPFANLMYQTNKWDQRVGSGAFTQSRGSIVATVPTDEFRLTVAPNGEGLPSGTYTVLNPSGAEIGAGSFSAQGLAAYTTATSFTFSYTAGNPLFIHCKGSLPTTSGNLAVILPGHLTSWNAGDLFNSAYITFLQDAAVKVLRFMNWGSISNNIEVNWADRVPDTGINFYNQYGQQSCAPYEVMCALANRLGADPWICLPPRCSSDYVTQFATVINSELDASRRLYLEHGNEIWNYGYPWGDGTVWIQYLDHTRRTATANPAPDTYTLTAHGITNGSVIKSYSTIENRNALASDTTPDFRTRHGSSSVLEVIDANTFRLRDGSLGGAIIPVVDNQVNLLFTVDAEPGKTADMNGHYAELLIRDWDIVDSIIGAGRVEHIVAGQAANLSVASGRLTAPVLARVDAVSPAPYFDHTYWSCAVDISTGQLLPKFWSSRNTTVHIGIYAAGATPSIADVLAGTGAINKQIFASNYVASTYTNGTAVTGLTNGTTYSVQIVVIDTDGTEWAFSGNATVSASTSTVNIFDSYDQQAKRGRLGARFTAGYVESHKALSSAKVICYEGGSHDSQLAPTAVRDWFYNNYLQSSQFADTIVHYLKTIASVGSKSFCYYSDIASGFTPFALASSILDNTDPRYLAFAGLGGRASASTLNTPDVVATPIATDPGSFPYTVMTFANSALTYSIINGDDNGNYDISGNLLRMVNDNGVNWTVPTGRLLTIEASNGAVSNFFDVSFTTGDAWYASDAKFAWSAVVDTDPAAIDPQVGASLPVITGTAATLAGGLLTFDGTKRYGNATGMVSSSPVTTPFLFAVVVDKNANNTSSTRHVQISSGSNFLHCSNGFSSNTRIRFTGVLGATPPEMYTTSANTPAGAHVHWVYCDGSGNFKLGMDQTENTAAATTVAATGSIGRDVYIGGADTGGNLSLSKVGAAEFVSRSGMTLSDALVIVQKMQTLHGI